MAHTFKDPLPLADDFTDPEDQAAIKAILDSAVAAARDTGFEDRKIASVLVRSAIDQLTKSDPAIMYDWTMAHARLFEEEHERWLEKPKLLIKSRDLRADHVR